MKLRLISEKDRQHGKKILDKFYKDAFLVPEKKEYLPILREAIGPYLAVEGADGNPSFMLDAASQIASLGSGLNPSLFFGVAQCDSAWSNRLDTTSFREISVGFKAFLQRKINFKHLAVHYCHSGAEANEIALGHCWRMRSNLAARKILAFEGSFHGRMQIALSSTWNASKRAPFEWDSFKTIFTPYPEIVDGKIMREIPGGWISFWENACAKKCTPNFSLKKRDISFQAEIDCLLAMRSKLVENSDIFAVIVEPMQCEGGDRYSSDRFNLALLNMCRSFKVPVIYDEVQTGFHLGREFFWHTNFNLRDGSGVKIYPDFVVCAKKSQVGLVLSPHELNLKEENMEFNVASLVRGYYHGISLDQRSAEIIALELLVKKDLDKFMRQFSKFVTASRLQGLAFSFDFKNPKDMQKFIDLRFNFGLLYYPAGEKTLRFRLNLSYIQDDIKYLFATLKKIASQVFCHKEVQAAKYVERSGYNNNEKNYAVSELLCQVKFSLLAGKSVKWSKIKNSLIKILVSDKKGDLQFRDVNSANFSQYKVKIEKLQKRVYEKTRQTSIENFSRAAKQKNSICFVLEVKKKLAGIVFASELAQNPAQRGVRRDPQFNNTRDKYLYMIDVTLDPDYTGEGLGKLMKYILYLRSLEEGVKAIRGRNRDHLAHKMLEINFALGGHELMYLPEDYLDDKKYRDAFYYTINPRWEGPPLNLASAINSPLSLNQLTTADTKKALPLLINKVCLSNFASSDFISNFQRVLSLLPKELQRGHTASGQSECVDKVVKALWYNLKSSNKILTFDKCFFGEGSFLSRSLSNGLDPFFPVTTLAYPDMQNWRDIIAQVEENLNKEKHLGVFIEPLTQQWMEHAPFEFLRDLRFICNNLDVALIYNETASSYFRYSHEHFFCANNPEITPDLGMFYLGGQMGVVFVRDKFFIDKPLMMISTWDGDEFSLWRGVESINTIMGDYNSFSSTRAKFEQELSTFLQQFLVKDLQIKNGCGYFRGSIPKSIQSGFKFVHNDRYLINPSYGAMKEFLER